MSPTCSFKFSLQTLTALSYFFLPSLILIAYLNGVEGNFFNSYPLITNDGFDWIFQGEALYFRLVDGKQTFLPVLRQPVFVMIWAFDKALNANGAVFLSISLWTAWLYSIIFNKELKKRASLTVAQSFLLNSALVFFPLNLFGIFVLCDFIAVTLGLVAFFFFWEFDEKRKPIYLLFALILAVFAGLIKTYGLIPFLISGGISLLCEWQKKNNLKVFYLILLSILLACLSFVSITLLWRSQFEYEMIPNTFSLLRFETDMTPFYINLWGFLIAYLLPVGCLLHRGQINKIPTKYTISLFVICLVHFILAFLYQYEDARFTFIYFVYILLFLAQGIGSKSHSVSKTALVIGPCIFLFTAFCIRFEKGAFGAGIRNLQIDANQSLVGIVSNAQPKNRLSLRKYCDSDSMPCEKLRSPGHPSAYRRKIYHAYIDLYRQDATTK